MNELPKKKDVMDSRDFGINDWIKYGEDIFTAQGYNDCHDAFMPHTQERDERIKFLENQLAIERSMRQEFVNLSHDLQRQLDEARLEIRQLKASVSSANRRWIEADIELDEAKKELEGIKKRITIISDKDFWDNLYKVDKEAVKETKKMFYHILNQP